LIDSKAAERKQLWAGNLSFDDRVPMEFPGRATSEAVSQVASLRALAYERRGLWHVEAVNEEVDDRGTEGLHVNETGARIMLTGSRSMNLPRWMRKRCGRGMESCVGSW
jgi:hypothetical protein